MAFESYSDRGIWSADAPYNQNANLIAMGKLGVAAGLGAGALYAGTRQYSFGRPVDHLSSWARTAGNLSPFQLGNTFRVPEFLYPFMSPKAQGLEGSSMRWEKGYLRSPETLRYLERVTGQSEKQLRKMGIGVSGPGAADALFYQANKTGIGGALWVEKGGARTRLSDDIMLMSTAGETDPFTREVRKLNRATKGVVAALGVYDFEGFDRDKLFATDVYDDAGEVTRKKAGAIPVPTMSGRVKGMGDLLRRTSYARGFMAFKAARFNDLLGGYTEQVFGETGKKVFEKTLGFSAEVADGPASAMMMRYGGRLALLGAGGLALSQSDWLRRNYGMPGQQVAIAATTGVAAFAAHKVGVSNKWIKAGAALSIIGQNILPGFEEGLVQGAASTAAGLDIVRGSPLNPFNYYRRTLEGFLPGVSNWETGALVAIGAVAASGAKVPFANRRISEYASEYLFDEAPDELLSKRDMFWRKLDHEHRRVSVPGEQWRSLKGRTEILKNIKKGRSAYETSQLMNQTWLKAEEEHKNLMKNSLSMEKGMNKRMMAQLERVAARYEDSGAIARNLFMQAEGFGVKAAYSFVGANPAANKEMNAAIRKLGFKGPNLGRFASIGAAAFGLHQLLTGAALGSMESSDELRDIYSGKKLVEVKKSRAWEFGGTPHGGTETKYFRPHALALMMNRTREAGLYGAEEDRTSPLMKFIKKNFTYEYERQMYYDRPAPITGAAFSDVPIIGGLLAATIGRVVKPPKVMHAGEWMREGPDGIIEYKHEFRGARMEPAYALGAPAPGVPTSPFSSANTAMNALNQFDDLSGLVGWGGGTIRSWITGQSEWGSEAPRLAKFSDPYSLRHAFWEAEIGGALGLSELWRRVLPPMESANDKYNPIRNSMPSWLPERFRTGDVYSKVQWGEARLPGAGYATLHPELAGVDPEDYPLIARYAILGDVAPSSYEFRQLQKKVYERRFEGAYSSAQEDLIDDVDRRVAAVLNQYSFSQMPEGAIALPGSGLTRAGWQLGQNLVRDAAAPIEYLTPMGFRPIQKLMGDNRSAIEQYEWERMYGSGGLAFWDRPWRDWFRPAVYSAAHFMGYEGKPLWRQEADAVNARFDELEFNKWMRLAVQAEGAGDNKAKNRYLWAAGQTRMGVNPQGSPLSIYWSLPEEERAYMNAFANAQGNERDRILEMIPQDQVHLYKSMWNRLDAGDVSARMPSEAGVDEAYLKARYYNQPAANLPPEDWVGFNAEVDMDDIRVRYASKHASDLHDYGLWEQQLKKSMSQEFLEGSDEVVASPGIVTASSVNSQLYNMLGSDAGRMNLSTFTSFGRPRASIVYNDYRDAQLQQALLGGLNGY